MHTEHHIREWLHHVHLPHPKWSKVDKDLWLGLGVLAIIIGFLILAFLLPAPSGVGEAPLRELWIPHVP